MTDSVSPLDSLSRPTRLGRYELHDQVASGGMAAVHVGRLLGDAGFSRTVAIKRLHPHYAREPEFVTMLLDEARLASRITHPNVISPLDVVAIDGEVFLVMEFVKGQTLGRLMKACFALGKTVPIPIAVRILRDVLAGLHAAHEARDAHDMPLDIIHRDVSPQNVMVGVGGVSRVLDFGIAKASVRLQTTREGQMKGKLPYMAPEQLLDHPTDRRVDVYATAVVMWEILCGRPLFSAGTDAAILGKILEGTVLPPSRVRAEVQPALDAIVMRGLARAPENRFPTAQAFALAFDAGPPAASYAEVAEWMISIAAPALSQQTEMISRIERSAPGVSVPIPVTSPETVVSRESVTQAMPLTKNRRRLKRGMGIVLVVVGGLSLWATRAFQSSTVPDNIRPQVAAPVAASVEVETNVRESIPEVAAPPERPPELKVATMPRSRVVKKSARKTAVPRDRPSVDCSVPFVVGPDGIRRVKRECLKSMSGDKP
jgi:eukaryotic-like serine/threonine-protein kinase